jgi:hypothetical protein|tara:strand:+ start:440 stop:1015 length:576 start_codon:yes stop_codon:yes gene_type:complete
MPTEYSATLLTPAEILTHVESDLATATLQRILDGEEEEIVKRFGSHAPDDSTNPSQTEKFYSVHGQKFIYLGREVASITSVTETESNKYGETSTTLSANDYEVYDSKRLLRKATGDNSSSHWQDIVTVVYVPYDDRARRRVLLINLCKLALQYDATNSTSVGEVSVSTPEYNTERENLFNAFIGTGGFDFA